MAIEKCLYFFIKFLMPKQQSINHSLQFSNLQLQHRYLTKNTNISLLIFLYSKYVLHVMYFTLTIIIGVIHIRHLSSICAVSHVFWYNQEEISLLLTIQIYCFRKYRKFVCFLFVTAGIMQRNVCLQAGRLTMQEPKLIV